MSPGEQTHSILVITKEPDLKKTIEELFAADPIAPVQADSAEAAEDLLNAEPNRFPVIMITQDSTEADPTVFLSKAKELCPFSTLFMIGADPNVDILIRAVNRGLVQRFVNTETDMASLPEIVRSGIQKYEDSLDNQRLLSLAKKQNTQLYDLNCQLMESAKTHASAIQNLEDEILALTQQLSDIKNQPLKEMQQVVQEVCQRIDDSDQPKTELLSALFTTTIHDLFELFSDYSQRNGFEMPDPESRIP